MPFFSETSLPLVFCNRNEKWISMGSWYVCLSIRIIDRTIVWSLPASAMCSFSAALISGFIRTKKSRGCVGNSEYNSKHRISWQVGINKMVKYAFCIFIQLKMPGLCYWNGKHLGYTLADSSPFACQSALWAVVCLQTCTFSSHWFCFCKQRWSFSGHMGLLERF